MRRIPHHAEEPDVVPFRTAGKPQYFVKTIQPKLKVTEAQRIGRDYYQIPIVDYYTMNIRLISGMTTELKMASEH